MERRGFLSMLGLGTAGMALMLPKSWIYRPDMLLETEAAPLVGIAALTKAIQEELELKLKGWGRTVSHYPGKTGSVIDGTTMTNQKNVALENYPGKVFSRMDWKERFVMPSAEALAYALKTEGLNRFGTLQSDFTGCSAYLADSDVVPLP